MMTHQGHGFNALLKALIEEEYGGGILGEAISTS
jgi:hypothetical protein